MYIEKLIEKIESDVLQIKNNNQDSISVDRLWGYLEDLKSEKVHTDIEMQKFEMEYKRACLKQAVELEEYKARIQHDNEMTRAVATFGNAAVKTVILINGGATIALLTFIGNMLSKGTVQAVVNLLS